MALLGVPLFEHLVAATLPAYAEALPIVRALAVGAAFWVAIHVVLVGTLQSFGHVRRQLMVELIGLAVATLVCGAALRAWRGALDGGGGRGHGGGGHMAGRRGRREAHRTHGRGPAGGAVRAVRAGAGSGDARGHGNRQAAQLGGAHAHLRGGGGRAHGGLGALGVAPSAPMSGARNGNPAEPAVTVVVVNYRTPEFVTACVDSLERSRGAAVRTIVVDNASGDGSAERLLAYARQRHNVRVLARDVNDGYAGGNNAGIRAARAEGARYVFVLNPDTTVAPDCVRLLADELEATPGAALAAPSIVYGDAPDRLWFGGGLYSSWWGRPRHVGLGRAPGAGWQTRRDLPFASGCALLLDLHALPPDVGPFDSSLFTYAEDLDLSLRLRRAGLRLRYVPQAVVRHFEGGGHRRAGGQPVRWYLNTRNLLRVSARHARWYHWITLAPMLAVDVVARYAAVALRDGDLAGAAAVFRGARDAFTGGSLPVERAARAATSAGGGE